MSGGLPSARVSTKTEERARKGRGGSGRKGVAEGPLGYLRCTTGRTPPEKDGTSCHYRDVRMNVCMSVGLVFNSVSRELNMIVI